MKWTQMLRWLLLARHALAGPCRVGGRRTPGQHHAARTTPQDVSGRQLQGRLRGVPQAGPGPRGRAPQGRRGPGHGRPVPSAPQPDRARSTSSWRRSSRSTRGTGGCSGRRHRTTMQHPAPRLHRSPGKFERGRHRGGGQLVNASERDRVRALQLMVQAMPLAQQDDDHAGGGRLPAVAGRACCWATAATARPGGCST